MVATSYGTSPVMSYALGRGGVPELSSKRNRPKNPNPNSIQNQMNLNPESSTRKSLILILNPMWNPRTLNQSLRPMMNRPMTNRPMNRFPRLMTIRYSN